jgi:hypothetical protein
MQEELNCLAILIHQNMEPRAINNLISRFTFLPIDWGSDLGIFTEVELEPRKIESHRSESNKAEQDKFRKKKGYSASHTDTDSDYRENQGSKPDLNARSNGKVEEKKTEYLYNVPYIFSKVVEKKHYSSIIRNLIKSLERTVIQMELK